MKLYSVKPEWLYGDDKDAKREAQLAILAAMGLEESESIGSVVCNGDQAIELFSSGYCGSYVKMSDCVKPIYTVKSEINVNEIIQASVSSTVESISKLFNEKTSQETPGQHLFEVNETMLKEDCCTDALQEVLADGWRILAICPQPQRRPDYVLGRKLIPRTAAR